MDTRRLRILIVDDDLSVREFFRAFGRRHGWEAMEACDGGEGLSLARLQRPDMVISAWTLPVLPGGELIRAIRSEPEALQPYIVVADALEDEASLAAAVAAGADDFIPTSCGAALAAARLETAQRLIRLQQANDLHSLQLRYYTQELARSQLRLREQAVIDALTGLPNRRHALESLERLWSGAGQDGAALSGMVVEMGGLKRINRRHGHERGDVALKTLAALIRSVVPTPARPCRLGGGEFLVICPEVCLDEIKTCATRLIDAFSAVRMEEDRLFFGLCIGVAERRAEVASAQALLDLASQGSDNAKRFGLDQVYAVQAEGVTSAQRFQLQPRRMRPGIDRAHGVAASPVLWAPA